MVACSDGCARGLNCLNYHRKKKKKKHNMSGDSTGAKSAGHLTLVIALMDGLGWISCSAYALLSFSVKFM